VRCSMISDMKGKKVITISMSHIDLQNVVSGESITAKVKTNFETEVPYEVIVKHESKTKQDNIV